MKTNLKTKHNNLFLTSVAMAALAYYKQTIQANQGGPGNTSMDGNRGSAGQGGNQTGNTGGSDDFDDRNEPVNEFASEGEQEENEDNKRITENDPDAIGKMTGRTVDESSLDLTDGGTTGNMYSSSDGATTAGQVTTPAEAIESPQENYGAGAVIKSGDIGSSNAGKDPSSPGGKYVEVHRKPGERIPGTGSGAASNDRGERIEDIDSGTGSAQRGNQAGVDDTDEGTIVDL
ncbi:hypothetical protein GXP67_32690 [Rhodocytophaga rosea]|uniref:Uncharacterized protein n=1 Tax=Rhodocytophaga rosea TaxID=2704465 RepID=A0A6C0GTE0_9BACT|nr:hypothetical protein [Rhodocytophaga rosea]QHT71074.1 hypothetical protein GXP67_32690 [Rhodocytophaga rosea]